MKGIVTKAEFSRLVGVSRGRVSQWLTAGKIDGAALVRVGRSERIDVKEARRQLGRRLDIDQRLIKGSRSRISGVGGDTLEEIQRQRLEQLELANAQARELALARAGRYVEAADAKREMGRIAERLVASVEGGNPRAGVRHRRALSTAAPRRAARAPDRLAGLAGALERRG